MTESRTTETTGTTAGTTASTTAPPVAARRPVTTVLHGVERVDEYAWLRDRDDPAVIAHLKAENTYTETVMAPTADLRTALFAEIKSRVQETDLSVPTRKGPYEYFVRTEEGKQYPIHCRRPVAADDDGDPAIEETLIDENQLADGHEYFSLGTFELSHDHRLVAYATDTTGEEQYTLRVRDLATGKDLDDTIEDTSPGAAWSADGEHLFYVTLDEAMRPWQLWRHRRGTPTSEDVCVFTEDDERFYLHLETSMTDELIFCSLHSQVTSEVWLMRADAPLDALRLVAARQQGIEYTVEHHRSVDGTERLLIVTNEGCESFRLQQVPFDGPSAAFGATMGSTIGAADQWVELVPGSGGRPGPATGYPIKLDGVDAFRRHLVLHERVDGLPSLRVLGLDDHGSVIDDHVIEQTEPVHSVWSAGNAEFDTETFRFAYMSLITPSSVYDYDCRSRHRDLRKQQPVLGKFDPADYVCVRQWAAAPDGVKIPLSVVHRRDTPLDGTAPGVLYGYGSYEHSVDPTFSVSRLSLLDRGFVFAIAHVRGGGELGRSWYLDGKLLNKRNTFTDFVAAGEQLISSKYVAVDRLVARGGSAGGLLVGAAVNLRPDLWRAAVAEVPFVDVVNTMLDESLPLTAIEWEEWGNPNDPEYATYMTSYAPYENVPDRASPDLLVTAGISDPRVGYWEPAKWVAKIRERTRAAGTPGRVLLKTDLGAGHGGPSGRYDSWHDEAFVLSFILTSVGIDN